MLLLQTPLATECKEIAWRAGKAESSIFNPNRTHFRLVTGSESLTNHNMSSRFRDVKTTKLKLQHAETLEAFTTAPYEQGRAPNVTVDGFSLKPQLRAAVF